MKNENIFRIFFDRVYDYFTRSFARRIFFFALAATLITSIYLQFWESAFVVCVLLFLAAVCALATLVDSVQNKLAFMEQLRNLEADYINRVVEKEGEKGFAALNRKSAFSAEEFLFMRKKKREYNFLIAIKLLFVIIFVVLFVNML